MNANPERLKEFSLFHILIIATFAIGLYSNTLKNGFVYDDEFIIINNTFIKSFDNLPLLFDKIAYFSRAGEMSYRPVVTFTYFIDYAFYGLKPWGYHLTNVLLHAINGALLYFFLSLLLTPYSSQLTSLPFLISLLFISHPVLTEAVNCISYREDLLAFMFYIATLSFYLILKRPAPDPRPLATSFLFVLSCLTYFFALLSKEMAVTLPLIVICYEWLYSMGNKKLPSRLFNRYIIGYIAITFFYLYLRFYLFYNPEEQIKVWSLVVRFLTLPYIIVSYIKLSLFPVQLSADYVANAVDSPYSIVFIFPLIVLIFIFTIIFCYLPLNEGSHKRFPSLVKWEESGESGFSRQRSTLFGTVFFLLTLIPVYNIVPIANPFAERYIYLPVVGFIMSTVCVTYIITDKLKPYINRYVPIIFLVTSIVFSFSVVNRNTIWRGNYSLWSDTVAKMPDSSRAYNGLGFAYYKQGRNDEAIREYLTAIKFRFDNAEAHNNLGIVYSNIGRYDEAIFELKTAIMLKPDYINAYYNLGNIYGKHGLFEQAIKELLTVLRLNPNDADAHYSLGLAYYKLRRYDEAVSEFSAALKLKPDYKEAYYNLEASINRKKDYKDAENAIVGQDKNWSP